MGIFFPDYTFNNDQYMNFWSITPPSWFNQPSYSFFPDLKFNFDFNQPVFANSGDNKIGLSVGDNFQISTKKISPRISIGTNFQLNLTQKNQKELSYIKKIFSENKEKYKKIESATGIPAELVCAIHYRESGCNFNTYLHNGDPLGKPTVHVPKGKFFNDWTSAAIDALKSGHYGKVSRDDLNSQLEFAERYNGLGYRKRGLMSPYVWSGTDKYTQGMYVADGKFAPTKKDPRVGVAAALDSLYAG